ncbi:hypothetical protein Tco_1335561 [Tanacetum coccineum]
MDHNFAAYRDLRELSAEEACSSEDPSFDEPEPQLQPLLSCPSLDGSLGEERGHDPPTKPHSPDSLRMKVIFDEKKLWSSLKFHFDDSWMMI